MSIVASALSFVTCPSAAFFAISSAASFSSIPMWLFTQLRHTAVGFFLHLLAMRSVASLSSFVLPCPLLPALTTAAIAAFVELNLQRASSTAFERREEQSEQMANRA